MEQLEPRTLLTAAISFLPQDGIGTITQEGPNTVLTLNPGTTTASISVRVSPTDISFVDYQLDLRASELGEGKLAIADWVTASGFSATDGALGSDDTVVSGISTGGAVLDAATIGSFTLSIPTEPGDYLLSALAGPVYTGELFYSRFINRIEETIEDFNSLINVTAIRDFSGNSVVVENQDYPNIFKTAYSYDGGTGELTYSPSQSVAQTLGADGIVSTSEFIIVGGQNNELFKVPINGGEIESATLNPDGGAFHMTLGPADDRVWTSMEPGNILAEVPIANFGSGIIEHNISGDDTQINKIAFAPTLSQQGNFAYYANSDRDGGLTGEDGQFGIINLETFVTTRIFTNQAAHSIAYDPYTGDLLLFGAHSIAQVDISDPMNPSVRSTLDLTSQLNAIAQNVRVDGTLAGFPANNFNTNVPLNIIDHSTVDGFGHAIAAVNTGHFIFLDYAGNTPSASLIENGTVFLAQDNKLPFLHTFLEGFAPVVGSNSNGGTLLTTEGGSVPLADTGNLIIRVASESEPPTITIEPTDAQASEADLDTGTFTVSRTGPTDAELEVFYTVSIISNASPDDYESLTESVLIPAGESSATITITAVDDDEVEDDETLTLTISPNDQYIVSLFNSATITIISDDVAPALPEVTLFATQPDANEQGPTPGVFTVTRTGDTDADLVIFYSVGGTASSDDSDYASLPGSVTIPAGETSTTITVTPVDDDEVEAGETVTVSITEDNTYSVGSLNVANVTIADNDQEETPPQISIIDFLHFSEGSTNGSFLIARTGPTTNPFTVFYTIDGTATPGEDYSALSGTLVIPASLEFVPINVFPIDDDFVESDETIRLTITPSSSYTVGVGELTITLFDDDEPTNTLPVVEITPADPEAAELGNDPGEFTITRTGPTTEPLVVAFSRGGTASAGFDYTGFSLQATIPAGESSVTITVTPGDDLNTSEEDETVVLSLIDNSSTYSIGSSASATVTIANNSVPSTASISGVVYNDANLNGTLDPQDAGVQSSIVYIDANGNGAFDQGERSFFTNAFGTFNLHSLPPGTYNVRVQLPSGRTLTEPLSGSYLVTVGVGEAANRNFGSTTGGNPSSPSNLTIDFSPGLAIPERLVPGDKLNLSGSIANTGGSNVNGNVLIGLFLVPEGLDVTDPASTLVGTVSVKGSALKPGVTANWSTSKAVIGSDISEGNYSLVAVADILNTVAETSEIDNIATREGLSVALNFGQVPGRVSIVKSLRVGSITYTIAGPGTGQIIEGVDGQPDSLVVDGATSKTTITAKADKEVEARILDVTVNGSANALNLKGFELVGSINVTGTLKTLTLGNIADQHNIVIGTPDEGDKSTLTFTAAAVRNLSITSGMPIKSIKVTDWIDDDATPDVITAPSIASITSTGDFHAAIVVTSNSVLVPLGKVASKGTLTSLIRSAGNIGAITAGRLVNSRIFAGVLDTVTGLPSSSDDFTPGSNAVIGKVTVSGIKGDSGPSFINSLIAAPNVGSVSLKVVQTANSGTAMGVAADNLIKSFKIASGFSATNVAIEGDQFIDDDFRLRIV